MRQLESVYESQSEWAKDIEDGMGMKTYDGVEFDGEKKFVNIESYVEFLHTLNESTDDYLFLWEIANDKLWFGGLISEHYALQDKGLPYCSVKDLEDIVYSKDREALFEDLDKIAKGESDTHNMEYRWVDRNGDIVWISCRGKAQTDAQGRPSIMVGRVSDTALRHKVDAMTGRFNKVKMSEDLDEILSTEQQGFLMVLGVDNLKNINIQFGREHGNQVLKWTAKILEDVTGNSMQIYRLDGDCFAIHLSVDKQEDVLESYREIQKKLADICTVSAGAVSYQDSPVKDGGLVYQYAEDALDKAKKAGKDRLVFFSADDFKKKVLELEILAEFKDSVKNGCQGFALFYQPQVEAGSYRLFGAEALLRYNSPKRGRIFPNDFIPILEETGLICPVGLWVLETALNDCRQWREKNPNFHVSVNVSYVQLKQENIAQKVLDILEKSGLPGEALTLEVTESMQLQDFTYFNKIFYKWKKAGIEISVDDFGTGYSSLAYLKSLKIDEIKIDRCFVSGIQFSAYNYQLLSNMLELARGSQIRVCCEGVEVEAEMKVLEGLKTNLMQGYFFSRPCDREQFQRLYIEDSVPEYYERLHAAQVEESREETPDTFLYSENLEILMGALEDIVYVSDMDTCELYYLNPAGCSLTGVYDYKGKKCYEVLQGKQSPCEFCNNDCLTKDHFMVWEMENEHMKRHFLLKDKLIAWKGKKARLEVALDVTEQEVVTESVQEKLDFAQSIVESVKALAEEQDMQQATQRMLTYVGDFYQADRAYVFELDDCIPDVWNNTYEWCREGVSCEREHLQGVPQNVIQRWIEIFKEDHSVIIDDIDSIRESNPAEWEILAAQNIKNLIVSPIWKKKKISGFIGVDNPRHCRKDDAQLQMMTLFVENRFQKNETEERLGELLYFHYQDILKVTDVGLWVIRIDKERGLYEMYADETMRRVMAADKNLTAEECYAHWYGRINDGYHDYVNRNVNKMIQTGKVVQLQYTWNHPSQGAVMVRCTGVRVEDNDGMICLEGYHRLISDLDETQFLPEDPSSETFEFNETKETIYFHTARTLLAGDESHEEDFPNCWIKKEIVHPHFREMFCQVFCDVQNKEDINGLELMLMSKEGEYSWFKLNTRHLGEADRDKNTILVQLNAANQERVMELENMRIRDFYHASLSEAIAYAELDLESGHVLGTGGIWYGYDKNWNGENEKFLQYLSERHSLDAKEGENEVFSAYAHFNDISQMVQEGEATKRITYQRKVDGEWRWVELIIHIFKDHFSKNMYALLYMKDVDTQKKLEIAQKEAAEIDSLTGVYNRKTFREQVEAYLGDPSEVRKGVLILCDLDDFKSINDQFGHLKGDTALKYVADCLNAAFGDHHIVGRFGGDEFLVFVKGDVPRETMRQGMEKLFRLLKEHEDVPILCSAGAKWVDGSRFYYQESIQDVDIALYKSKQEGKSKYCFVE